MQDYTSHDFANLRRNFHSRTGEITQELQWIINTVMTGGRLPTHDPYLIDVCITAIREIQLLRKRMALKPEPGDFLGGPMS